MSAARAKRVPVGLCLTLEHARKIVDVLEQKVAGVAQLEPRARLTLAQQLETIRGRLGAALNRELLTGVDLGGSVDRLELRSVYPVQDGLEVIVVFGGALRLVAR